MHDMKPCTRNTYLGSVVSPLGNSVSTRGSGAHTKALLCLKIILDFNLYISNNSNSDPA